MTPPQSPAAKSRQRARDTGDVDAAADPEAVAKVAREIGRFSAAQLEDLAHLFTPASIRGRARRERDHAIRKLAAEIEIADQSHRALASAIRQALARNAAAWRRGDAPPPTAAGLLIHEILTASGGKVPGAGTVRRILAGWDTGSK